MNPANEGRMAQINGGEDNLVKRKEYRNLNHNGQATGHGVHFISFVKFHHRLLLHLLIIRILQLQRIHLRLEVFHLAH